ncbi:dTDP-4-keto-6-deoxy-D-glucose epimerase [Nitriliruptoraceae bacterium ZYF776]|nr:dTDP-4-keto-6-deoxy-D-glucose epimerase [Profundirhabdus halotolerans]
MPVHPTAIDGLLVVEWPVHDDERGFFRQTFQTAELEETLGRPVTWQQGNHARSAPGVVRGFHAEPWDKLVQVVRGTAMAAIADVRPDSATFGAVETFHLGDVDGGRVALFVADGLGNAYATYGDDEVDYVYTVSRAWFPGADKRAVAWDDPDLAVAWPVDDPHLSDADRANPTLRDRFPDHARFATTAPTTTGSAT